MLRAGIGDGEGGGGKCPSYGFFRRGIIFLYPLPAGEGGLQNVKSILKCLFENRTRNRKTLAGGWRLGVAVFIKKNDPIFGSNSRRSSRKKDFIFLLPEKKAFKTFRNGCKGEREWESEVAIFFSTHPKQEDTLYDCKDVRSLVNVTNSHILARTAVLISVTCALCYLRMCVINGPLPQFSEHDNPAAFAKSWTTRVLTYLYLPAFNLWLLLCPSTLSYDWQTSSIPLVESPWELRNAASLAYLLGLLALTVTAIRLQGLERRRVLLSLSVMVFSFLPASNLLVTVGFVVAERVLYIPSLGFCLLVSHGLQKLMQRGPMIASMCRAGALLLILMFVYKTMARNNVWSSREALVRSGLESVPHNAKAHYNYANYKKDVGDKFLAIEHYRIALRIRFPLSSSKHSSSRFEEDRLSAACKMPSTESSQRLLSEIN
ncbi:protein O-mannosyl-transferase TMTC1 [Caerostris darwini]|uniref:Protein O-mannosyl-transferase TMTC1 n=1 Tax=Caerostris darwini TaxID=1538125 RepID=A0AAV4WU13_9ARAC|nr:protein O-mannosyl-transferase TMTC1 [Caerostris darwini]